MSLRILTAIRCGTLLLAVATLLAVDEITAQSVGPAASIVETEPGVSVEVLDWGGTGPALVLLAGLGATARDFDKDFVNGLEKSFHVYGITRRGYGKSSAPQPDGLNYSADP